MEACVWLSGPERGSRVVLSPFQDGMVGRCHLAAGFPVQLSVPPFECRPVVHDLREDGIPRSDG